MIVVVWVHKEHLIQFSIGGALIFYPNFCHLIGRIFLSKRFHMGFVWSDHKVFHYNLFFSNSRNLNKTLSTLPEFYFKWPQKPFSFYLLLFFSNIVSASTLYGSVTDTGTLSAKFNAHFLCSFRLLVSFLRPKTII